MPSLMYHFVGCHENLKGISLEEFRAQLNFLRMRYPPDEIVLTFDHGTIDHFTIAAPELERRGLKGIFFILTMIQQEHKVPSIDKQRRLETLFRKELARMLCAKCGVSYRPEDARQYLPQFGFYSPEERYLRFLRDHRVPSEIYEAFVGELFQQAFGDEKPFADSEYMSWHHVKQLHERGHMIGSHSHYHYGDKTDFEKSLQLIEERIHEKPRFISYPNGLKKMSDDDLREVGVETAYLSSVQNQGSHDAARIDCNQFLEYFNVESFYEMGEIK